MALWFTMFTWMAHIRNTARLITPLFVLIVITRTAPSAPGRLVPFSIEAVVRDRP